MQKYITMLCVLVCNTLAMPMNQSTLNNTTGIPASNGTPSQSFGGTGSSTSNSNGLQGFYSKGLQSAPGPKAKPLQDPKP